MQPHPQPAPKERPFLPGFKSAGLPGPFSVDARSMLLRNTRNWLIKCQM